MIDRRKFVSAAALAGIAAGAGATSALAAAPEKGSWAGFVPGTYSCDVMGHNAPFTVNVTFTDYALSAIDYSSNLETIGVGQFALKQISQQIIATQSLNVDSVTGATISSAALLMAVADCAEQAGGLDMLEAAPGPVDQTQAVYDADVCVIGAGGAGLTAAIRAAQAGARVVVLEKIGIDGGSTNVSEGALNAVDPNRQVPQGIEDSVETFYDATFTGGHEVGTPELIDYLVNNALDSVHWLEALGVNFKWEIGSATGSLGQRSHYTFTPSGNTYIRSYQEYVAANPDKITVVHDTPATELVLDGSGAVVGVKGLHKGALEVTVNAKAVVVATGGFGANVAYRQSVNDGVWASVVLDENIGCTNINPCAQGDGLALAEAAGAQLIGLSDIQLHPCGTPGSGLMIDIRTSGRNRIFVNKAGERFVNEGAARDALCQAIFAQPDASYFVVVNKLRYPSPTYVDANGSTIENMMATGHVIAGDTVEELAAATGMDAAKLQASIDGYNAVVAGEATDPLGFEANNTADKQLLEGPWYACPKVPTVHHTMGGIRISVNAEACDAEGNPVPGLFACGEVTGGIHGANRLGGNAICDCITFGRDAGAHAAAYAGFEA